MALLCLSHPVCPGSLGRRIGAVCTSLQAAFPPLPMCLCARPGLPGLPQQSPFSSTFPSELTTLLFSCWAFPLTPGFSRNRNISAAVALMSHHVRTPLSRAAGKLIPKIPWIISADQLLTVLPALLLLDENVEGLGQFRGAHVKIPHSLTPVTSGPSQCLTCHRRWAEKYLEQRFGEPEVLPSSR